MALTRAYLKGMGLTDEQVNGIIEAHTETVNGLKEQVTRYKEDAEKLPGVQKELEGLKANNGDDYKAKYEKEKGDFAAYKADVEKANAKRTKEVVYRKLAKDAGLSEKGIEKAVKYADWDAFELDEKGEAKDAKGQIKIIRDEWPEHIVGREEDTNTTATPPAGMASDNGNGNRAAQLYQQHHAALYGQTEKGESK